MVYILYMTHPLITQHFCEEMIANIIWCIFVWEYLIQQHYPKSSFGKKSFLYEHRKHERLDDLPTKHKLYTCWMHNIFCAVKDIILRWYCFVSLAVSCMTHFLSLKNTRLNMDALRKANDTQNQRFKRYSNDTFVSSCCILLSSDSMCGTNMLSMYVLPEATVINSLCCRKAKITDEILEHVHLSSRLYESVVMTVVSGPFYNYWYFHYRPSGFDTASCIYCLLIFTSFNGKENAAKMLLVNL